MVSDAGGQVTGWVLRVLTGNATFAIVVNAAGDVVEAAPIASWTKGKRAREVVKYFRARGATVEIKEVRE